MGDNSKIEWTDASWNVVTGCTKVSPGCDFCYAERVTNRFAGPGAFDTIVVHPDRLDLPLRWRRPRKIFVNSMSDLFHEDVPDELVARIFAVMALTRRHTFQVLTKRHGRMRSLLSGDDFRTAVAEEASEIIGNTPAHLGRQLDLGGQRLAGDSGAGDGWQVRRYGDENLWIPPWPLPNVWMGVSVEDQKWADIRIPALVATPAAVRFLSCEPLLGPVSLDPHLFAFCRREDERCPRAANRATPCLDCLVDDQKIGWVIVGGESGPSARPMHPEWARRLRDECQAAGVAYHFKQWGEWGPGGSPQPGGTRRAIYGADGSVHEVEPGVAIRAMWTFGGGIMTRRGKKAAGRDLDGRTWDEWPLAPAMVSA